MLTRRAFAAVVAASLLFPLPTLAASPSVTPDGYQPGSMTIELQPFADGFESLHARAQARGELELDGGGFRFASAGRGRYRLGVRDERWTAEPLDVDARAGNVRGLELRVVAGTRVRVRTGGRAATVLVLDAAGRIACYDELRADATLALPPGSYVLRAALDGQTIERRFDCVSRGVEVDLAP